MTPIQIAITGEEQKFNNNMHNYAHKVDRHVPVDKLVPQGTLTAYWLLNYCYRYACFWYHVNSMCQNALITKWSKLCKIILTATIAKSFYLAVI